MKKIGRYDIIEELGRGATGIVYRGFDPTIGRVVAVKVVSLTSPTEAGIPGAREIFMRETRAAGRLSHPGIVAIHDALEDPGTQTCCIVMEFVQGRTLENILTLGPPLETERIMTIIRQVAEALDYAHRQNVIHRDLKSDLFSLGVVFYMMLTAQKPFRGDTAAVMFKIVYEDPVPPSQFNSRLTRAHDYLVLRCLAKNREKRYPSARKLLDDLEDVRQGRPPRSEAHFPAADLHAGEPTVIKGRPIVALSVELASASRRKILRVGAAVGAGLVFLSVLFGGWTLRHRKASKGPATPSGVSPPPIALQGSPSPAAVTPGAQSSMKSDSAKAEPTKKNKAVLAATAKPQSASPAGSGREHRASPGELRSVGSTTTAPLRAASSPATPAPAGSVPSSQERTVELICRHDLEDATLIVSSGPQVISQWPLKGRKKGGFLGMKATHTGTLSRSMTIPLGVRQLSVRVVSRGGSFDLSKVIAPPPTGSSATLRVTVAGERLTVDWQVAPRPRS
ncbi:MAG: hypothetical protein DMG23_10300 [Acidobacteria bacterium]|nr:MAG: hypothetical protein DMG23_10300 [Acidobacteriota bacterium]